jgi:hypothetical protein
MPTRIATTPKILSPRVGTTSAYPTDTDSRHSDHGRLPECSGMPLEGRGWSVGCINSVRDTKSSDLQREPTLRTPTGELYFWLDDDSCEEAATGSQY